MRNAKTEDRANRIQRELRQRAADQAAWAQRQADYRAGVRFQDENTNDCDAYEVAK